MRILHPFRLAVVVNRRLINFKGEMTVCYFALFFKGAVMRHKQRYDVIVALSVLLMLITYGTLAQQPAPTNEQGTAVVQVARPATVCITSVGLGRGTGFVVDKRGYLLTNHHLIEGATEIKVKFPNGKEFDARLVGSEVETDVAVLQIEASEDFPVLRMGNSDLLQQGQKVVAIGQPLGMETTVTEGIVSFVGRIIPNEFMNYIDADEKGRYKYQDLIQTDADINPGNSGGPLINQNAEVIGINSLGLGAIGVAGLNFAIPINMAKKVFNDLVDVGHIREGWLGFVKIEDVPETAGSVRIMSLMEAANEGPGAPAWEAGFRAGDIITRFGNRELHGRKHLLSLIRRGEISQTVKLQRERNGQFQEVEVTIREMPDVSGQTIYVPPSDFGLLGIKVGDSSMGGPIVRDVAIGGPAYVAGIAINDVITRLNRQPIESAADFERVQNQIQPGSSVLLTRERQGMSEVAKIQTLSIQ
jgi:serine protease Do